METRAYTGNKPFIFVSYSHKDRKEAERIIQMLQAYGYRIWYDEGITPGAEFAADIAKHIKECYALLAFISPNSMASPNCRKEIHYAISKDKQVLSVFLKETTMPDDMELVLSTHQFILRHNFVSEERFLDKICAWEPMEACIEHERPILPVPPSPPMPQWKKYLPVICGALIALSVVIFGAMFFALGQKSTKSDMMQGSAPEVVLAESDPELETEQTEESAVEPEASETAAVFEDEIDAEDETASDEGIAEETRENESQERGYPFRRSLAAGAVHSVFVREDGTVAAFGKNPDGRCNVEDWTDIVAVVANEHTVGLKKDGSVVAVGNNAYGQCNVSSWSNIIDIDCNLENTVGLTVNGTVVVAGNSEQGRKSVAEWHNIVDIAMASRTTYGLQADGTLVAVGGNPTGEKNVFDWTDIVMIDAGKNHVVGLRSDGTVVAAGSNGYFQCNVDDWTDIVAISAGTINTYGLKSDGTVVATGANAYGQSGTGCWCDIAAIATGGTHGVAITADGEFLALGNNSNKQCDVKG